MDAKVRPKHRDPPKGDKHWPHWFEYYGVLATSKNQRKAVFERDNGICCDCGKDCSINMDFDADHDFGLHMIPPSITYPTVLRYWSLSNLKTRCKGKNSCHNKKSAHEAKQRAKVKRILKKLSQNRPPKPKMNIFVPRKPKALR